MTVLFVELKEMEEIDLFKSVSPIIKAYSLKQMQIVWQGVRKVHFLCSLSFSTRLNRQIGEDDSALEYA